VVEQADEVMQDLKKVSASAVQLVSDLGDARTVASVKGSLGSLRDILGAVERGRGVAHWALYDREASARMAALVGHADDAAARLAGTLQHAERLLGEARAQGLVDHVGDAARDVGAAARALREARLIEHAGQAAKDLASIISYIRSGRGTIGGVIGDPTIYEQLVSILGGVERSRILRAVVRYAVGREDAARARGVPGVGPLRAAGDRMPIP
jgi:phospholipid/cholesterol/gamma-HCH transport system substrate-binding protein